MNWGEYQTALRTMLQVNDPSGISLLNAILPRLVDDAELFLYRHPKLDFLATRTTDRTQTTTSGSRNVTIPSAFIVVEDVALITPAGAQPGTAGAQRVPMLRASRGYIDTTWPEETAVQTPAAFQNYWAIFSEELTAPAGQPAAAPIAGTPRKNSAIIIGPTPDGQYVAEFRGTFRPAAFYTVAAFNPATGLAGNAAATTFLSTFLPDLLISSSMIFAAAYQKNFGAAADNPQMAMSWRQHLEDQLDGAAVEEARKRSMGWNASPYPPPAVPSPYTTGPAPQVAPPQGGG